MIGNVGSGLPLAGVSARVASTAVSARVASGKDSPENIRKAAQQFEALLIGQVLKSAREAGSSGWLGTGEDEAGQTGMDMAEQQFAGLLASKGGLGLSRFITSSLAGKNE